MNVAGYRSKIVAMITGSTLVAAIFLLGNSPATGATSTVSGTHDGANNAAALTDSTKNFQALGVYAAGTWPDTVANTTDGSSCVITLVSPSPTFTTVTCPLSGGAENDWDTGDAYTVTINKDPNVDVQPRYNITAVSRLCNALPGHAITALIGDPACAESLALGGPRTTTTTFTIPEGQMNFSSFNTYEPTTVEFTPGCNVDGPDGDTVEDNRTYSAADGRSPTNADGIDNDNDGATDEDGECLAPGDLVGGMRSDTDLALFNGTCTSDVTVDFAFYNVALPNDADDPRASTNIGVPGSGGPNAEGQKDRIRPMMTDTLPLVPGPDGLADANSTGITKYPDWFLDLFDPDWRPWLVSEGGPQEGAGADPQAPHNGPLKPVIPIALYGAITDVAGTATPLYFAQFDDGILGAAFTDPNHYFNVAQTGMGQLNLSVLTDVTKARQESSTISDFCSELIARTMFFGTTLTNGMKRAINPSAAGTAITKYWTTSQRDTDNDSYENQIDTCPTIANIDDIRILGPGAGTGDPDLNRIDTACDPGGFVGNINVDNDKDASLFGFQNAQDNCPLIPNNSQEEQEDQTTASAADGGPKLDGIGNECDSEAGTLTVAQNSSLINITSSSVANPSVITTATNHGLSTGNTVVISNHTGSTPNINGTHTITKITNTTFSIPVNVTVGGTGGKVTAAFVSIPMSDTVANGHYHLKAPVQPRCYGGTDADGDGYCTDADGFDTNAFRHTGWSGSLTSLTAADRDGDAYSDYVESYLGTDPVKRCSYTTIVGDENSSKGTNSIGSTTPLAVDGWPADLNDSGSANNADVIYGFVTSLAAGPAVAIISSSVANPTVITTAAPHNLSTGNPVVISGHTGSTPSINATHAFITKLSATTFSIPVNVTVGGTGGTMNKAGGLNQNAVPPLNRLDLNADGFVNNQDVIFGFVTKLAPPLTGLNSTCTLETQQ